MLIVNFLVFEHLDGHNEHLRPEKTWVCTSRFHITAGEQITICRSFQTDQSEETLTTQPFEAHKDDAAVVGSKNKTIVTQC
jgi:hypothetical protein